VWDFVTEGSVSQLVILNRFMKERVIALNSFGFTEKSLGWQKADCLNPLYAATWTITSG
jgi:hypothetical protein